MSAVEVRIAVMHDPLPRIRDGMSTRVKLRHKYYRRPGMCPFQVILLRYNVPALSQTVNGHSTYRHSILIVAMMCLAVYNV